MATITWLTKIDGFDLDDPQKNVTAADMNEIKDVTNANDALRITAQNDINTHSSRTDNPHSTTKAQVGLGSVDNTSDATKEAAFFAKIKENIIPSGTINGSNVAFVLPDTPVSGTLKLYVDTTRMIGGGVDFTLIGANITMGIAPVSSIVADYRI